MKPDRNPFLLDPTKSGIFYIALFFSLIGVGLVLYDSLNGHYSIIGSVASFLAFFVAFQSWKAADDTSRKTDEALTQMHAVLHETSKIAQTSYEIDQQIKTSVSTISDSTRALFKGYRQILTQISAFLDEAGNSDCLIVMTATAAIGKMQVAYHPQLHDSNHEYTVLTDQIHDKLIARVRDAREFYLAALDTGEEPTSDEHNSLYHCYLAPSWATFYPDTPMPDTIWQEQRRLHQAALHEVQDTFDLFSDHRLQREAGIRPVLTLESLPFQVLIRVNREANEPYKALVIFIGQYNMDKTSDARAMLTADAELVRTFISMVESISGLDRLEAYSHLRTKLPL
ncbi:MAG TPA: hypothetical protein VGA96_09095 [Fibrella sp.]